MWPLLFPDPMHLAYYPLFVFKSFFWDPSFNDCLVVFGRRNTIGRGGGGVISDSLTSHLRLHPKNNFFNLNHLKLNFQQLFFAHHTEKVIFWPLLGVWKFNFQMWSDLTPPPSTLNKGNIDRLFVQNWPKKWFFRRCYENTGCRKLNFGSDQLKLPIMKWKFPILVWMVSSYPLPALNRLKNRPPRIALKV